MSHELHKLNESDLPLFRITCHTFDHIFCEQLGVCIRLVFDAEL